MRFAVGTGSHRVYRIVSDMLEHIPFEYVTSLGEYVILFQIE